MPGGSNASKQVPDVPIRVASAFDRYDKDHNGYLQSIELKAALKSYGLDLSHKGTLDLLKRYDDRPDRRMDLNEFAELVNDLELGVVRSQALVQSSDVPRPQAVSSPAKSKPPPPVPAAVVPASIHRTDMEVMVSPPSEAVLEPRSAVLSPPTSPLQVQGQASDEYNAAIETLHRQNQAAAAARREAESDAPAFSARSETQSAPGTPGNGVSPVRAPPTFASSPLRSPPSSPARPGGDAAGPSSSDARPGAIDAPSDGLPLLSEQATHPLFTSSAAYSDDGTQQHDYHTLYRESTYATEIRDAHTAARMASLHRGRRSSPRGTRSSSGSLAISRASSPRLSSPRRARQLYAASQLASPNGPPPSSSTFRRSSDGFDEEICERCDERHVVPSPHRVRPAGISSARPISQQYERRRLSSINQGSMPTLSPEVDRAATALRAEGKELSSVMQHLRSRCGPSVAKARSGRQVSLNIMFEHAMVGQSSRLSSADRTALFRLAHTAGLKRPTILPIAGGVRVLFVEEYPPSLDVLPRKLHAHASALDKAMLGHHERAVTFFVLLSEHHLGVDVRYVIDRPESFGQSSLRAQTDGEDGEIGYPTVPRLELSSRSFGGRLQSA